MAVLLGSIGKYKVFKVGKPYKISNNLWGQDIVEIDGKIKDFATNYARSKSILINEHRNYPQIVK